MTDYSRALRETQCVPIRIDLLSTGDHPRSTGPDDEHVARLAEIEENLPPILVDRRNLTVIDGLHRLAAARRRGDTHIEVRFFDGTPDEAFLRGVEANVTHGLPLSQADRRVAAERIVTTHPHLSDRAIARAAGLGAKTIATLRARSTGGGPQLNVRVGRDGRVRPLSSVEGRQRAAEVMLAHPSASLREVAQIAGISPATVSDVRKRLQMGQDPGGVRNDAARAAVRAAELASGELASGGLGAGPWAAETSHAVAERHPGDREEAVRPPLRRMRAVPADPAVVLDKLLRDPALRHKEAGRQLLRLLQQNAMAEREWHDLSAAVPAHSGEMVVHLARRFAETWSGFAESLDERMTRMDSTG
ncbi:ParB-like chromosome segregation protein Spo0J [Streptacidiphilus sp. MAP12-33]|uniref:ParB/RepB/Spo0J family partition protein n=1 Tax=Streptacidiphilus sp. MAP12-33 TaxID=3156266 RepID=UPI003515929D